MESASPSPAVERSTFLAILRGLIHRCPSCGKGALYRSYLKATEDCGHCGESFKGIRTDDAAPWLTILVVGHVVVALALLSEQLFAPPTWVQMTVWISVTLLMTAWFLPRAKGAILGLMWAKGLRGDETQ